MLTIISNTEVSATIFLLHTVDLQLGPLTTDFDDIDDEEDENDDDDGDDGGDDYDDDDDKVDLINDASSWQNCIVLSSPLDARLQIISN